MLIHILLEEVLKTISLKFWLSLNSSQRKWINLAEFNQKTKCYEIPSEYAMTLVSHMEVPEGCDRLGEKVLVELFAKENIQYSVPSKEDGPLSRCSFEQMSKSLKVCKHIYFAARVLGYTPSFYIRESEFSS